MRKNKSIEQGTYQLRISKALVHIYKHERTEVS